MKAKIPIALIYTRFCFGLTVILLSAIKINNFKIFAVVLLTLGLLTDIFDGIIARHLQVSTQQLRRLDSAVDQIFFISIAVATYLECTDFFRANALKLAVLLGLEGLAYLVSFLKFKKEIATHSLGSKIWTLFLFAAFVEVILNCRSVLLFNICFYLGLLTRLEIIAIILTLKKWTSDVPTFYHAIKLRQNKEIKRHKMFNG